MRIAAFIAGMALAVTSAVAQEQATELPQFWDRDTKPVALAAPNGKLALRVIGKKTGRLYPEDEMVPDYFIEKNGRRLHPSIHPYASPSALWSPRSDLLAIMSSDGGSVGNWKVDVYSVVGDRVVKYDVMEQVQTDLARVFPADLDTPFAHFSPAERKEHALDTSWVNVELVRWLDNPERLVVLAGVPSSSLYGANMGRSRGYIIDPRSGRILRTYTERQFKRTWGVRK